MKDFQTRLWKMWKYVGNIPCGHKTVETEQKRRLICHLGDMDYPVAEKTTQG